MAGCSCSGRLGNTGFPDVKPFGAVIGVFMMPLFDSTGTRNSIDLAGDIQAQLLAGLYNADPSKRIYPYLGLDTYTEEEAEATTVANQFGLGAVTRRGVRSVMFEKWGINEQFYKQTESACVEFGLFHTDFCGNIKGKKVGTKLHPIAVYRDSHHSIYNGATPDVKSMARFTMQYSDVENTVDDRWMIAKCEHNIDFNHIVGMFDVDMTITKVDSTNFTIQANLAYGTAIRQIQVLGLLLANFTFTDGTGATVTPSGISDEGDGLYTFTVTAVPATLKAVLYKQGTATVRGLEGTKTVTFP
jgi:hypothetical protein